MTNRELDKLRVIRQVLEHTLRWREAAGQLRLSIRQIARLCVRVQDDGNKGIIHRLRGRASNHQLAQDLLEKALELVKTRYPDFGQTFANEKLREHHHLVLSTWTLRQGMIREGLWHQRHKRILHRAWRPRRSCVEPANPTDAHRGLLSTRDVNAILSVQTARSVDRDPSTRTTASGRGFAQDSVVRRASFAHHGTERSRSTAPRAHEEVPCFAVAKPRLFFASSKLRRSTEELRRGEPQACPVGLHFTLRFKNQFFQLLPDQPARIRPGDTVLIEQRLDGTTHLRGKGRYLVFTPIAKPAPRPSPVAAPIPNTRHPRNPYRPPRTHPWKDPSYFALLRCKVAVQMHHGDTRMPPPRDDRRSWSLPEAKHSTRDLALGLQRSLCTNSQVVHPSPKPPSKNNYDYNTMTFLFSCDNQLFLLAHVAEIR